MIVCSNLTAEEEENLEACQRRALRDGLICIGWLKLISVAFYVCMYYLVHMYSKGDVSTALQILLLAIIPVQILHATLLFMGALECRVTPLVLSIWLCLIVASYNTVVGTIGCIYFIRTGFATEHFLLAFAFAMLAFSLFTVLCHDILMVYAYKQVILRARDQDYLEPSACEENKSNN